MKSISTLWRIAGLLTALVPAVAVACSADSGGPEAAGEEDFDGEDDPFLTGKADVAGIKDGSPEACAVLRLASEASLEVLDDGAALYSKAAANIVAARKGADGVLGTHDDNWFKDLAALDAVKWVGPKAFKQLRAYAKAHSEWTCGTVPVQLLAFNDFHGNLKPPSGSTGKITTGPNPATDFVEAGGAEFFATHMKTLKAQNENTLIVTAGDIIGATPLLSALFHDEPTIESMNLLGLDVASVGNHEFDEGVDELLRMKNGGCHPVDGCLDGDDFAGASFEYLAANVVDKTTKKTIFPSTTVRSFRGAHVGFIGLTLEGTPLVTAPDGVSGLEFKDEAETINALVPALQKRGVQSIVVLIHEGGAATGLYNECVGVSGPIFEIVKQLDKAVDVVVSGHTNAAHVCEIDGKLITSAAHAGRLITDIDLEIDELTGHVTKAKGQNVIATRTVAKDAEQTALITKYDAVAAPLANKVVASITADILKTPNAAGESPLGDVIADAQLEATQASNQAVAAFMNPGGIRADLVFAQSSGGEAAGQVTYGEAFTVQPFGNTLVTLTVTGEQIDTMLEQQWSLVGGVEKANTLQVSSGFSYTWDSTKPIGSRIDPATIKIDGVVVDPTKSYRITVNAFIAAGGDGFAVLKSGTNPTPGGLDLDALMGYMAAHTPTAPGPANRITRL
ncbi:MAG: bifunctional metallophosphatase/5'-nucleotidase [Polyangiaceae bacterium]|nr:bifunctional metallophosphatase/5'-nucleotidase [Polyangiaceae bacterium]